MVSIGLVRYCSPLPADFAWHSLLLATAYQKIIVLHYFSYGRFFVAFMGFVQHDMMGLVWPICGSSEQLNISLRLTVSQDISSVGIRAAGCLTR